MRGLDEYLSRKLKEASMGSGDGLRLDGETDLTLAPSPLSLSENTCWSSFGLYFLSIDVTKLPGSFFR